MTMNNKDVVGLLLDLGFAYMWLFAFTNIWAVCFVRMPSQCSDDIYVGPSGWITVATPR